MLDLWGGWSFGRRLLRWRQTVGQAIGAVGRCNVGSLRKHPSWNDRETGVELDRPFGTEVLALRRCAACGSNLLFRRQARVETAGLVRDCASRGCVAMAHWGLHGGGAPGRGSVGVRLGDSPSGECFTPSRSSRRPVDIWPWNSIPRNGRKDDRLRLAPHRVSHRHRCSRVVGRRDRRRRDSVARGWSHTRYGIAVSDWRQRRRSRRWSRLLASTACQGQHPHRAGAGADRNAARHLHLVAESNRPGTANGRRLCRAGWDISRCPHCEPESAGSRGG